MERYANDRAIQRKAKLGKICMFGGLGLMAAILLFSFSNPEMSNLFFIVALVGMLLSQLGIMISNRWGKSPRIDEIIDQGLKGLDAKYALFHYELGASHVLISPFGIFTLTPSVLAGEITFEDGKWRQTQIRRGRPRKRAVKNPGVDVEVDIRSTTKAIQRILPELDMPPISGVIVFIHSDAQVKVENSPIPAVHIKKLKPWFRKLDRAPSLSKNEVKQIAEARGF